MTLVELRPVFEAILVDVAVELAEAERECVELREGASVRVELCAVEVSFAVAVTVESGRECVEEGREEFAAPVEAMRVGRCLPVPTGDDTVPFLDAVCTACRRPVVALLATVALAAAVGITANPPVFAGRAAPVSTAKPAPTPTLPSSVTVAFRPMRGRVALEALVWADEEAWVELCAEYRAVAFLASSKGAAEALARQARVARTAASENGDVMKERWRERGERGRI